MVTMYQCDGCGKLMAYEDDNRSAILRNGEKVGDLCSKCELEVMNYITSTRKRGGGGKHSV